MLDSKPASGEEFKLTVGREAVVGFVLEIGELAEQVVVTGEAPLVDTKTSAIFGLADDKVIRDLPLNGRSFTQLATLQPGVTVSYYAGTGDVESGHQARPKERRARKLTVSPVGHQLSGDASR